MAPNNPTTTRKRKQAATPAAPIPVPVPVKPTEDEDIPSTRPAYLLLTPLLVIALLTYWALNTTSRITPSSYTSRPITHPPFEVRDLPGRGKGLIATRVIEPGERLTTEKPLIHGIPLETSSDPAKLILDALSSLPSAQQDIYYNLSYMGVPPSTPLRSPRHALAIFETNAVSAGSSIGLFPMMARLNHGCSSAANVLFSWRENEGILVTHAMRKVEAGQELLTHYITTRQPRARRRAYLKEHYHFDCACAVCSLPPDLSEASDIRLRRMTEAYSELAGWGQSKISGKKAIEAARRIWRLMEEEGYNSERGQLAADAATVAAAASDERATIEWAKIAEQWYGIELGADSEQAGGMRELVQRPDRHGMWEKREREDVGGMVI